ncbi:MAG: hypothetical protein HUJ29_07790 [Gammaproteobacteria bacterium]|nr:hypothetical protein [Gammaproteobacteria bacterium]
MRIMLILFSVLFVLSARAGADEISGIDCQIFYNDLNLGRLDAYKRSPGIEYDENNIKLIKSEDNWGVLIPDLNYKKKINSAKFFPGVIYKAKGWEISILKINHNSRQYLSSLEQYGLHLALQNYDFYTSLYNSIGRFDSGDVCNGLSKEDLVDALSVSVLLPDSSQGVSPVYILDELNAILIVHKDRLELVYPTVMGSDELVHVNVWSNNSNLTKLVTSYVYAKSEGSRGQPSDSRE